MLRRVVDSGVTFIDTADALGPHTNETLIHDVLWPYPADLVVATKCGFIRGGPGPTHYGAVVSDPGRNATHFSEVLQPVADRYAVTQPQLALAWLLHRSPMMLPIAGTSNRDHFDTNLAATTVHLTDDEVRTITNLVPDPESNTLG